MDEFEKKIIEDIACKYKEIKPLYKKLLKYMDKKYLKDIPTKLNIPLEEDSMVESLIDEFYWEIEEVTSGIDDLKLSLEFCIEDINEEYKEILKEKSQ